MGEVLLPRLAHEIDRPARHADVHLQEEGLAQPRPVHGLQIGRHALPVLVAVHEIPINSRPRGIGWQHKILPQSKLGRVTAIRRIHSTHAHTTQ